jgi:hypothetical protein
MGEVIIIRDSSLRSVLDLMRKEGLDEEGAVKKIIRLGITDYVLELYKRGDLTVREVSEVLQLSLRETVDLIEEKIGGNVAIQEQIKAIELARKLSE